MSEQSEHIDKLEGTERFTMSDYQEHIEDFSGPSKSSKCELNSHFEKLERTERSTMSERSDDPGAGSEGGGGTIGHK